ncbi:putative general secretion pathway protein N [Pseudomonas amygdali pv. mori str. 301020]|uniref:Putative general secretion pathway protein N n=1 Tax=Pseudomonas amygdali pv. mori str. 301020 TaxID=629261 RepID=A0A656GI31_PSEA0|nr:putative general secretion pathway protein N [Pseudomonas amygdali pv. mori str. 301020]
MNKHQEILKAVAPLAYTAGLLGMLWILFFCGIGSQLNWPEIKRTPQVLTIAPRQVEAAEISPSLEKYTKIWSEPLFTPGRIPDKIDIAPEPVKPVPSMTGYVLTGVIVTQQFKIALLKASTGEVLSIKEGQLLPNGWRLDKISERQIELVYEQDRRTIEILIPKLPLRLP